MIKIRIISPAKSIDAKLIDEAYNLLINKGFDVSVGKYAKGEDHYFSGNDEERLFDLQAALDDPSLDAILCARGGYGVVRLVDALDFTKFKEHPKLIMGYSDITVLHTHIYGQFGIPTLHCTAPLNFGENTKESLQSLFDALKGKRLEYALPLSNLNLQGEASGIIIGGNLSILYSLIGTNSDLDYNHKILFIEEIGEAVYSIDRMFYSLKKAGKLSNLKGVIVGGLTNIKDSAISFGKTAEEVIRDHVKELNIPVCFNFPAGHIKDNRSIFIGKKAELNVHSKGVNFRQ